MDKKNTDLNGSISMEEARRLAQSDAGKKLYSALRQSHGEQLQSAMEQANAGNFSAVKETITQMMNTPEIQAFLRQMGGSGNG